MKPVFQGKLSEAWGVVTKGAIAENILALTKLGEPLRAPAECVKTPTVSTEYCMNINNRYNKFTKLILS